MQITRQKRKDGELPKVWTIADVSGESPWSFALMKGLRSNRQLLITFGRSPPFRYLHHTSVVWCAIVFADRHFIYPFLLCRNAGNGHKRNNSTGSFANRDPDRDSLDDYGEDKFGEDAGSLIGEYNDDRKTSAPGGGPEFVWTPRVISDSCLVFFDRFHSWWW